VLCLLGALTHCATVRIVTPYDQIIDDGLADYRERIGLFVKNTVDKGGHPEGSFEANKPAYNELQTKIEMLIGRAQLQGREQACKLPTELAQRFMAVAGAALPTEVLPDPKASAGDAAGCTVRLLALIEKQLQLLMQIHAETDKCAAADGASLSCLRPATAQTALKITNQSIDAAWLLEAAKKKGEGG
jgi:hypothetical protein